MSLIAAIFAPVVAAQCGLIAHGGAASTLVGAPYIYTATALPGGGMLVGGNFTHVGAGIPAMRVAIWNNGTWSTLGPGVGGYGAGDAAESAAVLPNGDLVVGGAFQYSGSTLVNNVARWDGSAWHALGGGVTGGYGYTWVDHMVVMPNGDLVVAGRFYGPFPWLARWNGSTWSSVGGGGWEGIGGLAVAPNGNLLVAYTNGSSNGARVMLWDGTAWSQLGSGTPNWRVEELRVTAAGEIVAGGSNPPVAKWTGSTWAALGSQSFAANAWVYAIEQLPDGDLVAAGQFALPGANIARWNGSTWQPVGAGVVSSGVTATLVLDLEWLPQGQLGLVGLFSTVLGQSAANVARLASTCPANAVSYGASCSGSGGVIVLTPTALAMRGGTMRARTNGLAPNSLAVGVWGFSPTNVRLSSVHPAGGPGCNVLVADEILLELQVGSGIVDSAMAVPNNMSVVGMTLHHQVVPVEIGPTASINAITSSNAVIFTIGSF